MNTAKSKLKSIAVYLFIIAVLIASATPINSLHNKETVLAFFFASCLLILTHREKFQFARWRVPFLFAVAAVVFIAISALVNRESEWDHYISVALQMTAAGIGAVCLNWTETKRVFIKLVTIIALYSSIITVFYNIFKSEVGMLPVWRLNEAISWHNFYCIHFFWGWHDKIPFVRNAGFFREPGVNGCFLTLALFLKVVEIKTEKTAFSKEDIITLGILTIASALTLSTSTIFMLALCAIAFIFVDTKWNKKRLMALGCVCLAGLVFLIAFRNILFLKFNPDSINFVSFLDRFQGIISGLQLWIKNPVFGVGYRHYLEGIVGTSANSFTDVLGRYGIVPFMIVVYGLFRWIRMQSKRPGFFIPLILIMLIGLGTQNLMLTPTYLLLIFYGQQNENPHERKLLE